MPACAPVERPFDTPVGGVLTGVDVVVVVWVVDVVEVGDVELKDAKFEIPMKYVGEGVNLERSLEAIATATIAPYAVNGYS